jgi:dolichol-phosphate mannosyltransferase
VLLTTPVTVVIPAHNEAATLAARLAEMMDAFAIYRSSGYDFRYLVVDDGSVDETYDVGAAFASAHKNVEIIRHKRSRGLGAALRTAFATVKDGYAMVLDADLTYPPATGMQLLEALERNGGDIACASPYMHGGSVKNTPWIRRVLSREANRLLSLAVEGRIATLTSMVRVYRACILPMLEFRSDGVEAIPEMLLSALRRGLTIVEVPTTMQWSPLRRAKRERIRPKVALERIAATVRLALVYRPALLLAIPAVIPIFFPLVIAIGVLVHARPATLAAATGAALVVQYASLVIFAGQLTAFFRRTTTHTTHPTTRMITL